MNIPNADRNLYEALDMKLKLKDRNEPSDKVLLDVF